MIPEGCEAVYSPIIGSMRKIDCAVGDQIDHEDWFMVVESMKTEFTIASPSAGTIENLFIKEGDPVQSGQLLAVIRP